MKKEIHLDGILIVTINISMDRVLMVRIAFGSTIRSLMKSCSIKGFIYMMDYSKNSIIAFDLRDENFRDIGLGNDICDKIFNYDLIEVKGKIALLDCCGSFTGKNDLWILENSEKEEWKSHGIHISLQWKDVEDILKPKYGPP
ncbi:hypothetical protein H5410_015263 [Solanum commersonii]|uniref:F-box associated beta-propeller type 3 domain-containing protein n=1 Tax=Solanum commersonii TaxID=4109 RepID=A0A9J5ZTY4_SOLCO|nr:hypothetical protein H5410_015263 [Solanum commersonii]